MTPAPKTLLVVEDDPAIQEGLLEALTADGYRAIVSGQGHQALRLFQEEPVDLVLLDLMLPGINGYDLCRKMRGLNRTVPILMLTAKGEEIDKVLGLELGADDYITKPFSVRELLARIHAALRRVEALAGKTPAAPDDEFRFGVALVHRRHFTALVEDQQVELTARELHLLEYFLRKRGEVLSRDQLLNEVWGIHYQGTTRTLDQHIAQVRKKIGDSAARVIKTIHGVGYQYVGE